MPKRTTEIDKPIKEINLYNMFNAVNHFKTEKELLQYICLNIEIFTEEILGDKYKWHKTEVIIGKKQRGKFVKGEKRIRLDLVVQGERCLHVVELKNPIQAYSEQVSAIGQLMAYKEILRRYMIGGELVMVVTKYENIVPLIVGKYNLPFRYILFNKKHSVEFGGLKYA